MTGEELRKLLKDAWQKMHGNTLYHSNDHLLATCISFLANHWGDLHIEYMRGDGWAVSCCRIEGTWDNHVCGDCLAEALAKAVLEFGDFREPSLDDELKAWEAASDEVTCE